MQMIPTGRNAFLLLGLVAVLVVILGFVLFDTRADSTPVVAEQRTNTSQNARAMEVLQQGTTTKVLVEAYSALLEEVVLLSNNWTDQTSASLIADVEGALLSARVPAPLRAAHLQAVLQVQQLSSSLAVSDIAVSLRGIIQQLQAEVINLPREE